jgi:hypothetical protein
VQRAQVLAGAKRALGRPGLPECPLASHRDEGVQARIERVDAREQLLRQCHRVHRALPNLPGEAADPFERQRVRHVRALPLMQSVVPATLHQ